MTGVRVLDDNILHCVGPIRQPVPTRMDPQVVSDSRFFERYLLGQLSQAESRYFERMLGQHPTLLDGLDLPTASERLTHLLELTDNAPRPSSRRPRWCHPGILAALVIALVAAIGLAIGSSASQHTLSAALGQARAHLTAGQLPAPDHVAHIHVTPVAPNHPSTVVPLGDRTAPALAEMRIDVSHFPATDYGLVIRREDQTYWGRIDHLHHDSNGELSIAINVATFPAGRFQWRLESIDLHGEHHPAGEFVTSVSAP